MGAQQQKILVIQTAFLGDVVLTSPLLSGIRLMFPRVHLAVLVIPGNREILENREIVDEVISYDKKKSQKGIFGLFRMAVELKKRKFNICVLPHRSFRSGLLARLSGIPVRVGFSPAAGGIFYTRTIKRDDTLHEVRRNLLLLSGLNTPPPEFDPALWVTTRKSDAEWAVETLGVNGITPADNVAAIAPGSVWGTKRWTPAGFSALADRLIREESYKVILVGSGQDSPVAREILSACKEKPVDLTGRTTLTQLAAVFKHCRLLITNDNGAMHVGVAQKIPVVSIFGSTTLSLGYGPFTENARVVETPLDCRPCGKHGYRTCPKGHFNCMNRIHPDMVFSATRELVGRIGIGD